VARLVAPRVDGLLWGDSAGPRYDQRGYGVRLKFRRREPIEEYAKEHGG
jgi:hypothetical protein